MEDNRLPFKISAAGRRAVKYVADETGCTESDVVRAALSLYLQARGIQVDLSPGKPGVRKAKRKAKERGNGDDR